MSQCQRAITVVVGRITIRMDRAEEDTNQWSVSVRDEWLHKPDEWYFMGSSSKYGMSKEFLHRCIDFFATLNPLNSLPGFVRGEEQTADEVGKFFLGWPE